MDEYTRGSIFQATGGMLAIIVFTAVFALAVGIDNLLTLPVAAVWVVGSLVIGAATVAIIIGVQHVRRRTAWERARADRKGRSE